MSKKKKGVKPNQTIVELLKKIKVPIYDKTHNLNIYFKEKSKSNETGIEHAAKSYHGLQPSDVEMLVKGISKPLLYVKDKKFKHVFNTYYLKRKDDKKNAIKVSILIDVNDPHRAEILTIFITSKIK